MAAAINVAAEEDGLTIRKGDKGSSSDDIDESIDLGISVVPPVNFSRAKNEFQTINLDGDDEGEEDRSEEDHSDEKRKKRKYKKKRKKHPVEELSESSSDDDERRGRKEKNGENGPSDLTWTLWLWYYIVAVSSGAFRAAEYIGEKLAAFFGITTPKYQYVLNEYYRLKELEKEEQEQELREQEFVAKREAERLEKLEGGAIADEPINEGMENYVQPSEQTVLLDDKL